MMAKAHAVRSPRWREHPCQKSTWLNTIQGSFCGRMSCPRSDGKILIEALSGLPETKVDQFVEAWNAAKGPETSDGKSSVNVSGASSSQCPS